MPSSIPQVLRKLGLFSSSCLLWAFLTACSTQPPLANQGLTPQSCMAVAEAYRTHVWMPTSANVKHARDADGISVDTPDTGYRPGSSCPGYWTPGHGALGIPYQWGGFCTPAEFDAGVRAGLAAGDVYTAEKRRLLDAAVSRHACGIDCSGFISRCWQLPRSYSTRELPGICRVIPAQQLRPGDVLNTVNAHCILFGGWVDTSQTSFYAYHTGSPPHWRVVRQVMGLAPLLAQGFVPLRYVGMEDRPLHRAR